MTPRKTARKTRKPKANSAGLRMLRHLQEKGQASGPELSRAMGIKIDTVYAALKTLAKRKEIELVFAGTRPGSNGHVAYVWAAVGAPRAEIECEPEPIEAEIKAKRRCLNIVQSALATQPDFAKVWMIHKHVAWAALAVAVTMAGLHEPTALEMAARGRKDLQEIAA